MIDELIYFVNYHTRRRAVTNNPYSAMEFRDPNSLYSEVSKVEYEAFYDTLQKMDEAAARVRLEQQMRGPFDG